MSNEEHGGPAFPCIEATMTGIDSDGVERFDNEAHGGMTLRDYFAAKAMLALITKYGGYEDDTSSPSAVCGFSEDVPHIDAVAKYAYSQADAMLAERNKKGGL